MLPQYCGTMYCILVSVPKREWISSGVKMLKLVLEIILVHVFIWLLPFYMAFKKLSDIINPPIPLTKTQKASLLESSYLFEANGMNEAAQRKYLDSIGIVFGASPIGTLVMGANTSAMALERTIYVNESKKKLHNLTLLHEFTHCLQFERHLGGAVGFLSEYFAEYIAVWSTNGRRSNEAYRMISAEQEAFNNEKRSQGVAAVRRNILFDDLAEEEEIPLQRKSKRNKRMSRQSK